MNSIDGEEVPPTLTFASAEQSIAAALVLATIRPMLDELRTEAPRWPPPGPKERQHRFACARYAEIVTAQGGRPR